MIFAMYWKQIVSGAFIAIILSFAYYKGYSHEKRAYDSYKLQMEALSQQQQIKNADIVKKQQVINKNITKEYSNAVHTLKSYYASHHDIKWLPAISIGGEVSDLSDTTKRANDTTESNQPSAERVTPLDCADDVLQLLNLQKWVTEQTKNYDTEQ
jgi:hypothetical protein